jgi:hypothetical protein
MAASRAVIIALTAASGLQPLRPPARPSIARTAVTDTNAALPMRPSPDLEPIEIVNACFGGLQQPDEPLPDAGYERLFHFCTYTCRKAITARMGADSLANFTKHTELSPAVQPFTRAASIRIVDEPTIIAGTPTRGPMATVGVDVFIAPSFRHASGYEKESDAPEALRFAIRLQQERRPPKNWLITEILDTRYAFAGDTGNDLQ